MAFSAPVPLEIRVWAELVDTVFGNMPWLGIIWLLLAFPTGRLEGGLERAAALVLAVMTVLAILSFGIGPEPLEVTGLPSPVALDWLAGWTAWFVGDGGRPSPVRNSSGTPRRFDRGDRHRRWRT